MGHKYYCPASYGLVASWITAVLTTWSLATVIDRFVPVERSTGVARTTAEVLSTWDGANYSVIASTGYSVEGAGRRRFAFFPLLPAIARVLGGPSGAVVAGILFGQLCLLGCMILINDLEPESAQRPLRYQPGFWLLITPMSFFFLVFYTESLFLFLTLLMIAACRREQFAAASVVVVMAWLTRPIAVCLPVIFLWWALRDFSQRRKCLGLLVCAAAPLIGVSLYIGAVGYLLGDPFAYVQIQRQSWRSDWVLPFLPLIRDLETSLRSLVRAQAVPVDQIARLFSSISMIILIVWGWRRYDPAFRVYLIASMIFIHSQEPHRSTARYELLLFPVFFLIPRAMMRHARLSWVIPGILVSIEVLLFLRHITRHWVA